MTLMQKELYGGSVIRHNILMDLKMFANILKSLREYSD